MSVDPIEATIFTVFACMERLGFRDLVESTVVVATMHLLVVPVECQPGGSGVRTVGYHVELVPIGRSVFQGDIRTHLGYLLLVVLLEGRIRVASSMDH